MQKKWIVDLAEEERNELLDMVNKGTCAAYKIKNANILLKADQGEYGDNWTDAQIAEAFGCRRQTVENIRRRYVERGLIGAIERQKRTNYQRKLDGDAEAKLISITCSSPPEGYSKWTMKLLADKMVSLEYVESVSEATICRTLKKNELKPWQVKEWCIPDASGEFVAKMEDILEVYKRPYNQEHPVICFDETNKQLIEEKRVSVPMKPGFVKRIDCEYKRNGVVNLFMIFEPLTAKRFVQVKDRRTAIDFAHSIKYIVDVLYKDAKKIILVMDNLNTHKMGSLYEAFEPEEARRITQKLEVHYTPKHGSWLNMAEIEIGVMSQQCLDRYIPSKGIIENEVSQWYEKRNAENATVNWQFTTEDARTKLRKLYPNIEVK